MKKKKVKIDDPEPKEKKRIKGRFVKFQCMHSNSYLPHFKSGRALPDPGSSHNFMEEGLARELQGDVEVVGTHAINIAIGHDKHTNELCKSFSWMIQGTMYTTTLLLIPLRSFDLISWK